VSRLAIVCSGQGSQAAGMFDLLADAPEAAAVFEAARPGLDGRDPCDVVQHATDAELHANMAGQILCCTQAMAAWAVLRDVVGPPAVVAGYSVGELAAWGVAGLLDAASVLDLAVQRSSAMDAATKQPSGLAAIRGLTRGALEPICNADGAYVAIVNAPDQIVVGGTKEALAAVISDAMAHGATHATALAVAVPSHTPLLAEASQKFRQTLSRARVLTNVPGDIRLLSSVDGQAVSDMGTGLDKLARQISHTVDWAACMTSCREAGIDKVLELGPGNALARMMHTALPDADVHGLTEFRSLAGVKHWLSISRM